jgi:hypothetical protein
MYGATFCLSTTDGAGFVCLLNGKCNYATETVDLCLDMMLLLCGYIYSSEGDAFCYSELHFSLPHITSVLLPLSFRK